MRICFWSFASQNSTLRASPPPVGGAAAQGIGGAGPPQVAMRSRRDGTPGKPGFRRSRKCAQMLAAHCRSHSPAGGHHRPFMLRRAHFASTAGGAPKCLPLIAAPTPPQGDPAARSCCAAPTSPPRQVVRPNACRSLPFPLPRRGTPPPVHVAPRPLCLHGRWCAQMLAAHCRFHSPAGGPRRPFMLRRAHFASTAGGAPKCLPLSSTFIPP
jgi:hypothetical protein